MDKLSGIIEFFREKEGCSFDELVNDTAAKTKLIDVSLDEIWIDGKESGEEDGCDLDTLLREYTNQILKQVCNVIESFK